MTTPAAPLSPDQVAFIEGGVSITVAARDRRCVPSLVKALGCRVSADARTVTLFVLQSHAAQLLADIEATAVAAAVFSRPSTHHTIQLKGSAARVLYRAGAAPADDIALLEAQRRAFADELVPLGYTRDFALAIHAHAPADIAALAFGVDAVYAQTPGPGAGARIGGGA